MMLAEVPGLLREAAAWLGAIGIVTAGVTAIFTRKPFRWLWRRVVSDPFADWTQRQVGEAVAASDTAHLVEYHLGPNHGTKAMHARIAALEFRALMGAIHEVDDDMEDDA
jgi:hypothetical protein